MKQRNFCSLKIILIKKKFPFVIYADLESILEKASDNNYSAKSNSKIYQNHVAFSVAYYLKCSYNDSFSKFNIYRGKDCIQWFVKSCKKFHNFVMNSLK
jgi:helix-turn-helix protein